MILLRCAKGTGSWKLLLLAALLPFTLNACTKEGALSLSGRTNAFTQPHVLRVAMDEDVTTLNPWFSSTAAVSDIAQLTMAYLFRYDQKNRPVPELATFFPTRANGGVSGNGRVITFHLRHGVRWADGEPFSAADVVFSFKQYLNNRNNVTDRTGWRYIRTITSSRPDIVTLTLTQPYAQFEPTFFSSGGPCILPKHLLGKSVELNDVSYNALPVGIGPFKVAAWKRADDIVLMPNALYWRGMPKLARIDFRIIPSRNTTLQAVQTGDIDLWLQAPAYFIDRFRRLPGFVVQMEPSYTFSHIDFNLAHPILADVRVRQALRYATDRRMLRDKIAHGIGILQESVLSPTYPNAPAMISLLPYNREKAAALLDSAGWLPGPDGIRQKNGRQLRLDFALGSPEVDSDATVELLRGWWQDIGVAIDVKHYDTKLLFAPYKENGIIFSGRYDVTMFSWQLDPFDSMRSILGCDAFPPYGQNNTHYCNEKTDRLMHAFDRSYNPIVQKQLKGGILHALIHDVPLYPLLIRENIWVANADLKHFHPSAASSFDDMMNVDI